MAASGYPSVKACGTLSCWASCRRRPKNSASRMSILRKTSTRWSAISTSFNKLPAFHKLDVAFQEMVMRESLTRLPLHPFEYQVPRFSAEPGHAKKDQQDRRPIGIGVLVPRDLAVNFGFNPKFLAQFPLDRRPRSFACLHLAARKLPLELVGLSLPPLAN